MQKPLWKFEHPAFTEAEIPTLSSNWVDISSHNDTCPSFWNEEKRLKLWVEREKVEDREADFYSRYSVVRTDEDACGVDEVVDTEDWVDVENYLKEQGAL